MNIRQKAQIETMKKQGCTIRKISNELNVPVGNRTYHAGNLFDNVSAVENHFPLQVLI